MCPMLNVLLSPDHGLNHDCAEATQYNSNFEAPHEVITYILSCIYQIYHPGEDLYEDYIQCQHGLPLQFLIMELVRYDPDPPDPNDDDDDDPDPEVLTIDIYHHERTYLEMIQHLFNTEGIVNRVSDLVL